jgi:hypothetical protein
MAAGAVMSGRWGTLAVKRDSRLSRAGSSVWPFLWPLVRKTHANARHNTKGAYQKLIKTNSF